MLRINDLFGKYNKFGKKKILVNYIYSHDFYSDL